MIIRQQIYLCVFWIYLSVSLCFGGVIRSNGTQTSFNTTGLRDVKANPDLEGKTTK